MAPTTEEVRIQLRKVPYPGFQSDIVSSGFVKNLDLTDGTLTVHFSPNTRNEEKVQQMEEGIHKVLEGLDGIKDVKIILSKPFKMDREEDSTPPLNTEPISDEELMAEENRKDNLRRVDLAPGAGYGDGGPGTLGGPEEKLSEAAAESYEGEPPVLQWDIDPTDPAFESGEANHQIENWEFRVWWQVHPSRLVYAAIQALKEDWADHKGTARQHPVGRSEAVNLVYDLDRKAVVAIYGTVKDFRPFVEAFREGYIAQQQ